MKNVLKYFYIKKKYKEAAMFAIIFLLVGLASFLWQFWVVFDIFLYITVAVYFSRAFRNIMDIHMVALTVVVLHAVPSTILILNSDVYLTENESLMLFSAIGIGLIGYVFGVLLFRKIFSFDRKNKSGLYVKINDFFWLLYNYRYLLAFISIIIVFFRGFMPSSMSYSDSVAYRMEVSGITQYLNSLFAVVFSVLVVALISIVGDIKRNNKLSFLSYLFIFLTVLSVIAGYRIWIIALFAALILVFQSRLKRRYVVIFVVVAFLAAFIVSGGVRAARGGKNFSENLRNFYTYFLDAGKKPFVELMWGFSDFTVPFSTFITIVRNVPQNISFQYYLYLKDSSLFIPTAIYSDRPLPVGVWYVKNFEPELYAKGGGLTFYVIGYGYLLAGPLGVFFHLFLWGGLLELINKIFKKIDGAAAIFLYSYFFISLFSFTRGGEIFSFIKTSIIMYFILPLLLLILLVVIIDSLKLKKQKI